MANPTKPTSQPIKLPIHSRPEAVHSNAQQPEYDFVVSTGSKKSVDADARRTIRSRVMRTYLQEKRGQKQNVSVVNSDSTVKAGTSLKGRFRLKSRERQEEEERNPRQSRKSKSPTAPGDTPSTSRVNSSSPYTTAVVAITNAIVPNHYPDVRPGSPTGVIQPGSTEPDNAFSSTVATIPRFQENRIDPFNTLPVPGGLRLERLLYYYNNYFYVNSNAVNPTRTWYGFVFSENALFHAMCSTVALCAWKYSGLDTKPDMLYHQGQTLRKINNWLHAMDTAPLDLLIATICTMTSLESLQGNYATASTHITALKRILFRHNGLSAIQNHDSLQRAVGWTVYHHSAVARTIPFYRVQPAIRASFPDDLLLKAARSAPTSILNIPSHGFEIYNILHRIHHLGLAVSEPWMGNVDRVAVSNTLHEAEYDMLVLSAKVEEEEGQVNVAHALLVASQIFLYSALRLIPLATRTCDIFLQRLMKALEREDLLKVWTEQCSLEALLWAVCMGLMVAEGKTARSWLLERMEEVVQLLQVADFEDLESILKNYAWSDYCGVQIRPVWEEVALTRSLMGTPELEGGLLEA